MAETRGRKRLRELINDKDDFVESPSSEQKKKKARTLTAPRILDGKYFLILTSDWSLEKPEITAQCQTCNKTRKGSIRSTGNFIDHYKSCHPSMMHAIENYRKGIDNEPVLFKQTTLQFSPLTTAVVRIGNLFCDIPVLFALSDNNICIYSF